MIIRVEEKQSGIYRLRVEGYVDYSNSFFLLEAITLLSGKGVNQVRVDLSRLSYIDEWGIAGLIEAQEEARSRNMAFTLTGIRRSLDAVFDSARVKGTFVVVRQEDLSASHKTDDQRP
jgi:anti-anti-sigma factor